MIKGLLFKSTPENSFLNEASITFLRVTMGLLMAYLHGSSKLPPSEQLIGGVTALGFPQPHLFAWMAGLAELVGGLFLAVGFLTRPSAFLIGFTMFVAAFGTHSADPWNVKELALIYMAVAIIFITRGAGKWSVDNFLK